MRQLLGRRMCWGLLLALVGFNCHLFDLKKTIYTISGRPMTTMKTKLDNGMTVILLEEHKSPVVAFQIWVNVGSADEKKGEYGLAHLHEHMIFKGTKKRRVGEIAADIESHGGEINAWTSLDQTVYHVVISSRYFNKGLEIMADAIQNASFDEKELHREIAVVLEEIKRSNDIPTRVLSNKLFKTAYNKHPYARPILGEAATLKKFSRAKVLDFYKHWYVPNNIVLVVVGDFKSEAALKKIKTEFQHFAYRELQRKEIPKPSQQGLKTTVIYDKVKEAHINMGFHTPDILNKDIYALDLISVILGQGISSRLKQKVKRNQELVNDVYAFVYNPKSTGFFYIGASLNPDKTEKAFTALLEETYRLKYEKVSREELERAKKIIESDLFYQKETVQGIARKLGFYELTAGDYLYELQYYSGIKQVTQADIVLAAQKYFTSSGLTTALLLPEGLEKRPLDLNRLYRQAEVSIASRFKQTKKEAMSKDAFYYKQLENGLRLIIKENHDVPIVSIRGIFLGGVRYESGLNNGISNYISELITKGTQSRNALDLAHEIDDMAGSLSGFSGRNSFGLKMEILSSYFQKGIELFADCLLHPSFDEKELEKERKLILEELKNQEDNLGSSVFKLFNQAMYSKHPYRYDALGTPDTIKKLTQKDLVKFYKTFYTVNNLVLVIVGDVSADQALEAVTTLFQGEKKVVTPAVKILIDPVPTSPKTISKSLPKEQAHIVLGFPGTTVDSKDRFVLEVISVILSGQGGRLFMELRDKKSLAYSLTSLSLEGIEPGYFAVYLATSPSRRKEAISEILIELKKIISQKVTPAELERAKRYLIGTYDISLQKYGSLASLIAFNELYQLGYKSHLVYAKNIDQITTADVYTIANKYFKLDRYVLATIQPGPSD